MHTRRADHPALLAAFFVVLPLQYVIVGTRHFDLFTVFIPVYAFIALPILGALGNDPTRFLERISASVYRLPQSGFVSGPLCHRCS
jgi:phosphatidate cytidylyltransferase